MRIFRHNQNKVNKLQPNDKQLVLYGMVCINKKDNITDGLIEFERKYKNELFPNPYSDEYIKENPNPFHQILIDMKNEKCEKLKNHIKDCVIEL